MTQPNEQPPTLPSGAKPALFEYPYKSHKKLTIFLAHQEVTARDVWSFGITLSGKHSLLRHALARLRCMIRTMAGRSPTSRATIETQTIRRVLYINDFSMAATEADLNPL